jgi:hypothetical protein
MNRKTLNLHTRSPACAAKKPMRRIEKTALPRNTPVG